MMKRMFALFMVLAFCLSSMTAFANAKQVKNNQVIATMEQDEDAQQDTQENEQVEEDENDSDTADEDTQEDTNESEQSEEADEDTDESEEADENEQEVDKNERKQAKDKKNQERSKIVKEELNAKKQERKEAKLEAKEYIKELRSFFKDADAQTKKEILKEIAQIKRELKDYSIGVFIRGIVVDFERYDNVKPIIKEGRTLVPIRAIIETFGAAVEWDEETSTITITKDHVTIVMQIGNTIATVNGEEVTLDVAPTVENGRTLVPVRFISEALTLTVDWDDESQTVIIEE